MSVPLLTTKLYAPRVRRELVPRPRLTERLNTGLRRRLTLLSAPAGFGKTTLVAEWLSTTDRPVAWLSLDETDNDPARFFAYLVAALQKADSTIGSTALAMLQAPQSPPSEALLTSLVNDIAATPEPFVLVIDDYHVIQTLAIHQQLTFLLEHLPPQMHIILISREDPPFPLSRLQARGQMTDIRQTDLRFTEEETRDFAQRVMHVGLSAEAIATLHTRTEGWVTGLQFATLSMQRHHDVGQLLHSLTGNNRYILDYLMDEVFRQQSPDVQDFLLKTSILERLTASLCDAISGREDSDEVLMALERANLFIVPLDEVRQWYRYHHLFGDLLRHRLETNRMGQVHALHIQASQWFADNDFLEEAVHHTLAAADWSRAAALISSGLSTELLRRGEMITLRRWIEKIPDTVICDHLQLCVDYAWSLILTEQLDTAERYLVRAEELAESTGKATEAFLGGITVAHVHIARVRGDHARTVELSEKALVLLPEDALSERSIVAINLGITQWFAGHLDKAEAALKEAERTGRESKNLSAWITALVFQNRILNAQGKSREAAHLCRQIIDQGDQSPMTGLAHYDLGRLLYEWNELDAAADHIERGIALNIQGGSPEFQVGGYSALALIKQAQGDITKADEALEKAAQRLDQANISPPTRLYNLVVRLLVAMRRGDLETATRIEAAAPPPQQAGSFPDLLFLMQAQARLAVATHQREKAAQLLAYLHGMALSRGWYGVAIQTSALQALVAPNPEEALSILSEALTQASPASYTRTFVDAGEPMAKLLRQALARGIAPDYAHKLLAAFDFRFPIANFGKTSSEAEPLSITGHPKSEIRKLVPVPGDPKSQIVEPLSDRELDVLHLLENGLTNQEMAQSMHVSVNTVKTHLKNIYGKLDVHNRKEAVAHAEASGLL